MRTFSFQAPDEIKARLEQAAKLMDRSKGYVIREALSEYLNDLDDYIEAKSYKESYNPKQNISLADLKKKHKLK